MEIDVVLGANYGDEGKGVMVNALSMEEYWYQAKSAFGGRKARILNILFNGGVQRGHTVKHAFQNHIFHCFGSGSYWGADTYYFKDFIVNPIGWVLEAANLAEGYMEPPMLYIDEYCRVTTIYDEAINQMLETKRGNQRHGSCGLGILETRIRNESCPLYVHDLLDEHGLYQKLSFIRDVYFPYRCKELGLEVTDEIKDTINDRFDYFMIAAHKMVTSNKVEIVHDDDFFKRICKGNWDRVIFEGGQGLLLSELNEKDFPHLTPSITGSEIIAPYIKKIYENISGINLSTQVFYMTRTYLTRHGAGPLPTECKKEDINPDIKDETNMPNEWQGSLRFGYFDPEGFVERTEKDFSLYDDIAEVAKGTKHSPLMRFGITHCDYTPNGDFKIGKDEVLHWDKLPTKKKHPIFAFYGTEKYKIFN